MLNGINLEVSKGQIIGYIGPNGAGKSTNVKIMLGLIDNYKGKVVIFGQNISTGDPSYKRRIGLNIASSASGFLRKRPGKERPSSYFAELPDTCA